MSDPIRDSFTQFYGAIQRSYQLLDRDLHQVEDRKGQMLSLLENDIRIPEPPAGTGEYQLLCRGVMHRAALQIQGWQKLIRQQIQRSEFVNRHEKSILALAFADVNTGKSSLGNFVGGWYLRDTAYADLYQPHECHVEDYSAASQEDRQINVIDHFEEKSTEATSTIQHYTLAQGLTWVDTPGLHSLTAEHGELAQEYIQFADLVVYLTSSTSPFKKDEQEMLEKLFKMGKPVILAITKSDYTPSPCVRDGKLVFPPLAPKSPDDRMAQEVYVTEQLKEISGNDNLENSHVLSLSVMLARDAVRAGDGSLYAGSNLDKFLAQMGDILSEKAVELKTRRPKAEANAFIQMLLGGDSIVSQDILTIAQLRKELKSKCDSLRTLQESGKVEEMNIYSEVERQLPTTLSLLFRGLRDRGLLGESGTVQKEMSQEISRLVAENCCKQLQRLGSFTLSLELPAVRVTAADGKGYQVQYMEQLVAHSVERDPRGLWEHVEHFIDKDKKFYSTVTRKEYIATGDNLKNFLNDQLEQLKPEVRKHVAETVGHMLNACVTPLLDCYQQLDQQLASLAAKLEELQF